MDIKLGMPEVLVVFALIIYPQSFTFASVAFCLGLLGRTMSYVMNYSIEMKKAESINQSVNDLGEAFNGIFGGDKK